MHIDNNLVGLTLKPYRADIGWRQTTNYAAAVQDTNPHYFDDAQEKGLVSHPMFAVAVTWPILSRLEQFLPSGDFPKAVLMTQVHYSEHLVLHRLVRPGDRLTITGTLRALLPHRAGTHAIIRLAAKDEGGSPVFTEYTGAMFREVDCGPGGKAGEVPGIPDNAARQGVLWRSDIPIDAERPYVYDGCTDIVFPIHTSPAFARQVGLPGIILQGTATLAYAVREVVNREAGADPARILEVAGRFTGMVRPGTRIQVACTGKTAHNGHTDLFFEVRNSDGQKAIRNGYVKLRSGE